MICELCGKEVSFLKSAVVERTTMEVCTECMKFADGDLTAVLRAKRAKEARAQTSGGHTGGARLGPSDVLAKGEEELVLDYPDVIRNARMQADITQEALAKKINEKKSIIAKLETGHMRPNNELIRKLERALDIKLREKVKDYAIRGGQQKSMKLTLGDFIKRED